MRRLGLEQHIDPDLVIPDKDRTLRRGAISPWAKSSSPYYVQTLQALGKHYRFTLNTQWKDLPKKTQDAILYGSGDTEIRFSYDDGMRAYDTRRPFEGVVTNLERRYRETDSDWAREEIARYFTDVPCDACKGYRLKPEALCVKVGALHIGEVSDMSVKGAAKWFTELPPAADSQTERNRGPGPQGDPRAVEIFGRCRTGISDPGARLRHALRRREPAHPARLANRLGAHGRALCARRAVDRAASARQCPASGNAEATPRPRQHRDRGRARRGRDPRRRLCARYPAGAGIHGGHIVAQGKIDDLIAAPQSWTGKYLSGELVVPIPERRPRNPSRTLKIIGARGNNLKNITAEIPLGLFTCVTGVSGGGKSTLLVDTLYKALARRLNNASEAPAPYDLIEGVEHLDKIIDIDQSPIGRTPRSNPATSPAPSRRSANGSPACRNAPANLRRFRR